MILEWFRRYQREILKILVVFPVLIIKHFSLLLCTLFQKSMDGYDSDSGFYNTFFSLVFSRSMREGENLTNSLFNLTTYLVFIIMFGTYIYKEININSIYALIRYPNRKTFFLNRTVRLFFICVAYSFLQVLIPFVWTGLVLSEEVTHAHLLVLFSSFLTIFLYNSLMVYMVNLASIGMGSVLGFISVYGIMLISFLLSNEVGAPWLYLLPTEVMTMNEISEGVTIWDFLKGNKVQWISTLVILIYIVILMFTGMRIVAHKDVSLSDQENIL